MSKVKKELQSGILSDIDAIRSINVAPYQYQVHHTYQSYVHCIRFKSILNRSLSMNREQIEIERISKRWYGNVTSFQLNGRRSDSV